MSSIGNLTLRDFCSVLVKNFVVLCVIFVAQASFAIDCDSFSKDPAKAPEGDWNLWAVGTASVKDSDFEYCELHFKNAQEDTHVLYFDKNGQQFGYKKISPTRIKTAPEIYQEDTRRGKLLIAELEGDNWELKYREKTGEETESETKGASNDDVLDAGFDIAVREYWKKLIEGDKFSIDFVSPLHLKKIKLRVVPKKDSKCVDAAQGIENSMCIWIEPANFFLRLFAGQIKLIYNVDTRQLATFDGVVNFENEDGDAYKAIINYSYPS